MDKAQIQHALARPAVAFTAGGFRPSGSDEESWLGKVFLFRPEEELPLNPEGEPLLPLAQFHLPSLPMQHPALEGVKVLTVFIDQYLPPEGLDDMGPRWLIREYREGDTLVRKDLPVARSFLKPFPLKADRVEADYPLWDGGGVPPDIEDAVLALENAGQLDSYYDLIEHCYLHKIGGYPSYCQSGVDMGDGFEFVFQISSDEKINLNVVDSGSLMFWKHRETGEWAVYYDFY